MEGLGGIAALDYIISFMPEVTVVTIVALFIGYFAFLALPFLLSLVIHASVWLLRGGRSFGSSFRAVSYSIAPTLLIWPVLLLSPLSPEIVALASGLFSAVIFVWCAYLLTRGLKAFHQTTRVKALLAAMLPAMVMLPLAFAFAPEFLLGVPGVLLPGLPMQVQSYGISMIDHSYGFDGAFSVALKNIGDMPVTISDASANCGQGGSHVSLESTGLTHLQPSDSIAFSVPAAGCIERDAGEVYLIQVSVRYIEGVDAIRTYSGLAKGRVS
jgi:hypothetical protein